ncbi:MAG: tRNA threonylcarbamoyladenosine dehydratase [Lachnospiraceae bacterium]|nr:tRNA threonylcarbamoyladenosine dehydratase [Lachnospiraceae bacterium]
MEEQFARTELLLGSEGIERLRRVRVAVFGIGGVGGYAAEALARSGVGELDLIDDDRVCLSNLNRQIIALHSTVGRLKTEVMRERILDINPEAVVHVHNCFFLPENAGEFPFEKYDYIVDAVDTVTAKLELVLRAQAAGRPIISCMGTGNKLDPTRLRAADIYETKVCPLARVMRSELKKRGVKQLRVVYSEEQPIVPQHRKESDAEMVPLSVLPEEGQKPEISSAISGEEPQKETRRRIPGSVAFVPPAAGLIIAGEVVRGLLQG